MGFTYGQHRLVHRGASTISIGGFGSFDSHARSWHPIYADTRRCRVSRPRRPCRPILMALSLDRATAADDVAKGKPGQYPSDRTETQGAGTVRLKDMSSSGDHQW